MRSSIYHWGFSLRFIIVVGLLSIVNTLLFPLEKTLEWMIEDGIVENATIFMYYLALASLWLFPPQALTRIGVAAVSLLLVAAAARELDLHKAMFGMSILKTNFYRSYASGAQIAGALLILLPIFAAIIYLTMGYGRRLMKSVKARDSAAVTVATTFVFLVLLKIFDSAIGIIGEQLGKPGEIWGYTTAGGLVTMALEESLELALPLLVVIAVIQARRPRGKLL
jgi:hypothetical protein